MSEPIGTAVICQQCEDFTLVLPGSKEEMRAALESRGWRPYGTGVTPLAEENADRGWFECARCTNELIETRLNRISHDVLAALGIEMSWVVIRSADRPEDYLRLMPPDSETVQVEIEHARTHREMRELLKNHLSAAFGRKSS